MNQAKCVRDIISRHNGAQGPCVTEIAAGLASKKIPWKRNTNNVTPEDYANNLYHNYMRQDGLKK